MISIQMIVHITEVKIVLCNANGHATKCPDSRLTRCPHFRGVG